MRVYHSLSLLFSFSFVCPSIDPSAAGYSCEPLRERRTHMRCGEAAGTQHTKMWVIALLESRCKDRVESAKQTLRVAATNLRHLLDLKYYNSFAGLRALSDIQ